MSNKSNKSRFDKYLILFGDADDKRASLFLHILEENATKNGTIADDIKLTEVPKEFQTKFFKNKRGQKPEDIHPEWREFLANFYLKRAGKTEADLAGNDITYGPRTIVPALLKGQKETKAILDIIKELAKAPPNTLEHFMQKVVQAIMKVTLDNPDNNLTADPQSWNAVTKFTYNTNDELKVALFEGEAKLEALSVTANTLATYMASPNTINDAGKLDAVVKALPSVGWKFPEGGDMPDAGDAVALINAFTNSMSADDKKNAPAGPVVIPVEVPDEAEPGADHHHGGGGMGHRVPRNHRRGVGLQHGGTTATFWVFINKQFTDITNHYVRDQKNFSYNINKLFMDTMLLKAVNDTKLHLNYSKFFKDDTPNVAEEIYYRKVDDDNLYTKINGIEVAVNLNSAKFKDLVKSNEDDKCMGTGFRSDVQTCGQYLITCLATGDVEKCKDFLKDTTYWTTVQKEVNEMLPAIALKTLSAFEFGFVSVYNETSARNLTEVQSVDNWLKSLTTIPETKLSKEDLKKITDNIKLTGYLKMLVNKINSNPAILNKDYTRPTNGSGNDAINTKAFEGTRLYKMGLKPIGTVENTVGSVLRLGQAISDSQNRISVTFRLPHTVGQPQRLEIIGGGTIENLENFLANDVKQTWSILQNHYINLIARLKTHNKTIAEGDDKKINELLKSLKNSELKLTKIILLTEKYAKLLDVHGQSDPETTLSVDHLKDFVEQRNKYFQRVVKKQNDLLSIIKSIAEAVTKETPTPTPAQPQGPKAVKVDVNDLL